MLANKLLPVFTWPPVIKQALLAIFLAGLSGCQHPGLDETIETESAPQSTQDRESEDTWHSLQNTGQTEVWEFIQFGGRDAYEIDGDRMSVEMGYPLAGFVYTADNFPTTDYHLSLDARKTGGTDFFCCLTFPVKDQFCSFVVGGWGGTVTGISCVDLQDASENETKTIRKYETGQWYRIDIRVTKDRLSCLIDGDCVVDLSLEGIELSVRTEVDPCKPLGLCSFSTSAEWKNTRYKSLK